jgi:hypothetical protein
LTHQVEHIVAKQHGGSGDPNNLALVSALCGKVAPPDPVKFPISLLFWKLSPSRRQYKSCISQKKLAGDTLLDAEVAICAS